MKGWSNVNNGEVEQPGDRSVQLLMGFIIREDETSRW